MSKIKEAYVSFETAKLLKEKGFECFSLYVYTLNEEGEYCLERLYDDEFFEEKTMIFAPTQQMAMKWLREVHNLFIQVELYQYTFEGEMKFQLEFFRYGSRLMKKPSMIFSSYEEAVETAIKYTLENLI